MKLQYTASRHAQSVDEVSIAQHVHHIKQFPVPLKIEGPGHVNFEVKQSI